MPGAFPGHPIETPWVRLRAGHHEAQRSDLVKAHPMIRSCKKHLGDADEGYFKHLRVAAGISLTLAKASLACAIHALVPGLCTRTASRSIADLQARMAMRSAQAEGRRAGSVPRHG